MMTIKIDYRTQHEAAEVRIKELERMIAEGVLAETQLHERIEKAQKILTAGSVWSSGLDAEDLIKRALAALEGK